PGASPLSLRTVASRSPEERRMARAVQRRSGCCAARGGARRAVIVTIDGGVASGKSAVGRRVAEKLGLPFIDSGLMYRAITRLAMQRGIDTREDAERTGRDEYSQPRLR